MRFISRDDRDTTVLNIWLFGLIVSMGAISVYSFAIRRRMYGTAIAVAMVLAVYVRGAQHLNPHISTGHDGYFYFSVVEGILETGGLNMPISVTSWYPTAQSQTPWPSMHIYSAILGEIIGITTPATLRSIAPSLLGAVLFAVLLYLYKPLLGSRWAIIAAFWTTMQGVFVRYQTEYHAQSLAFIAFALLFAATIRYSISKDRRHVAIASAGVFLAATAHHFSALVIVLIAWIFVIGMIGHQYFPHIHGAYSDRFEVRLSELAIYYSIVAITIHLIFPRATLSGFLIRPLALLLGNSLPAPPTPPAYSAGNSLVDSFPLYAKFIVFLLVIPTLYQWIKKNKSNYYLSAFNILSGSIMVVLTFIAIVNITALIRLIALMYIPTIGLAVYGLKTGLVQNTISFVSLPKLKTLVFCSVIIIGVFAGVTPSLIDHSADINSDRFDEISPIGKQAPYGGSWINSHISEEGSIKFQITFNTRMVVNYFGKVNLERLEYVSVGSQDGIIVVDSQREKLDGSKFVHKYYSNGRIVVVTEINNTGAL